jgi:hypothetical protein
MRGTVPRLQASTGGGFLMPKSEPTQSFLKRLQKIEAAHGRLGELATRIHAQADTIADLVRLGQTFLNDSVTSAAKRSPAKRTTAKRTTAKRTTAKRTTTKRTTAKRSAAKRTTAKRTTATRTTAKPTTARRTTAKRSTAKRPAARRRATP